MLGMTAGLTAGLLGACAACALFGCGDGIHVAADAGGDDATLTSLVRVRIQGMSSFEARVLFQNPDSTLVLSTRTLGDGTANAYMPRGGFVTVITIDGMWTYAGVEPGDELVLGERFGSQESAIQLQVPPDPDAASYWIHSPCASFLEVTGTQIKPRDVTLGECDARTDLLLITRKVGFSVVAHYQAKLDVEVGTEGAAPLVQFDGPYLPPATSTVRVTDVPDSIGFLYTHQEIVGSHGLLYDSSTFGQNVIDTGAGMATTLTMPLTQGTRLVTYLDDAGSSGNNLSHVVTWAPSAAETSVGLGALQLPPIFDDAFYGVVTHSLIWREGVGALVPEAVIADLRLQNGLTWHVLGPRGAAGVLTLPVLPLPDVNALLADAVVTMLATIRSTTGMPHFAAPSWDGSHAAAGRSRVSRAW
ncbi:MAG: hypothetical protein IPQ07_15195 [Myxococcales bacterium]|nr:hypothetical protein [Myxococcales bacterium]